ncbi:hypothetical protein KGA66_02370 [Actinocrinis puniceicyclus]|uniref:Uncharacterized protein n=1 Tax=Actinocrinis puniceicyclus TaxID=977794 RepID=A0A8J7WGK0_9ACTN|nr:hypothetical protein [Actinocrinis puniceicyclus]MBS2961876.1 hypothetical protein [Actinocrinis puniceicyclus]
MASTPKDKDFLTQPRPWQKQIEDTCPVDGERKVWIEDRMLWLSDQFGAKIAQRELAVPGPAFYPKGYRATPEAIRELVRRVEVVMGVEPGRITVQLFDGSQEDKSEPKRHFDKTRAVGHYWRSGGDEYIDIDVTKADDPAVLTAIIAHELAHARLIGEGRCSPSSAKNEELTDLATVFLRMGIFVANASITFQPTTRGWSAEPLGELSERALLGSGDFRYSHLGYLDEPEYGYAFACLCGLRREQDPAWAVHLDPTLRVLLRRSLAYFKKIAQTS